MPSNEQIDTAYWVILGREADPSGLAHYRQQCDNGLTLDALGQSLLSSEEFRHQNGAVYQRVVDIGDALVVVDPHEGEFGRHIAQHGGWEPHIMEIIRLHLGPGSTYVDVGANVGIMAFVAAAAVSLTGRVLAFEPHPDNIRNFLAGVRQNDFKQIRLHGFALSDAQETFSLVGPSNGYLMPGRKSTFQAITVRGDDILQAEARVDFVKIDVEGHEPFVLDGLEQTLRRHKPMVLCEFAPRCLKEHIGRPPPVFADQLFKLTDSIDAIQFDGSRITVRSADELLKLWSERNRWAVSSGFLPDGMIHFDLLFRVT